MPRFVVGKALIPSRSVVENAAEKEFYLKRLLGLWNASGSRRNHSCIPVSNPCSISRNNLEELHRHPYLMTLKSDGVRYSLLLTVRMNACDAPVALMIDRSNNMFEVEVLAHEDFFLQSTILEGELVWQQPEERVLNFLIFDAIWVRGVSFVERPFHERIRVASEITSHSNDSLDENDVLENGGIAMVHYDPLIRMRPKIFVEQRFAVDIWNDRGEAGHRVDGLIFCHSDASYVSGMAGVAAYKWKEHSSVDLTYSDQEELATSDGPLGSELLGRPVVVHKNRVVSSSSIVEYDVTVKEGSVHFFATRTRPDKNMANSRYVVERTVQDVLDGVQVHELC